MATEAKRCCVVNCSTVRVGKNDVSRIAMHKLPPPTVATDDSSKKTDEGLRKKWLLLSGSEEKDITPENEFICGRHFLPKAYHHLDGDPKKHRRLNENSVPSIFLPHSKENSADNKKVSRHPIQSEEQAASSTALIENESNHGINPSLEGEEIEPMTMSLGVDATTGKHLSDDLDVQMDGDLPTLASRISSSKAIRRDLPNGVKKNVRTKLSNGSPGAGISSDNSIRGTTVPPSETKKSFIKVARIAPAAENGKPVASSLLDNSSIVQNGSSSYLKKNETSSPCPVPTPPKRHFCEDSQTEVPSESHRRKMSDAEQKSHARMKICPRRSDLEKDVGAVNRSDVIIGAHNKHAYLKGFTEALLSEALRQLENAFGNRNAQMKRALGQLKTDSEVIEKGYEQMKCRLNQCKGPQSTRNVGTQITTAALSLPTLTTETSIPQPTPLPPPAGSNNTQQNPQYSRRGRPFRAQNNCPRPAKAPEPVIDLTDDQPPVSIVRVPNPAPPLASSTEAKPTTASPKFTASYTRQANVSKPLNPVLGTPTSGIPSPGAPAKVPSTPVLPTTSQTVSATRRPSGSSNVETSAFPIGRIFPGQKTPVRTPAVATPYQIVTPTSTSQSANQNQTEGNLTIRLPRGIVVEPVNNLSISSPVGTVTKESQNPTKNQQVPTVPSPQPSPAKTRSSTTRARHPAPLPETPSYDNEEELHVPPAPLIDIKASDDGIELRVDMKMQNNLKYSPANKYQIYSYTDDDQPPSTDLWKFIGTIEAVPLPMEVKLCSYEPGHRYFFAVRGVDQLDRFGPFNEPKAVDLRRSIVL